MEEQKPPETTQNQSIQEQYDPKKAFLDAFKELGFRNKAAKKVKVKLQTVSYWLKTDPEFQLTYEIWQDYWKETRKEALEDVMLTTGMTPAGHRDRMEWLKKNYPQEYGLKTTSGTGKGKEELLKELGTKAEKYKKKGD